MKIYSPLVIFRSDKLLFILSRMFQRVLPKLSVKEDLALRQAQYFGVASTSVVIHPEKEVVGLICSGPDCSAKSNIICLVY